MTGMVLSGGEASKPFEITNGVKQGCVLAPVPFNLFFTCVLSHAVRDIEDGVYIRYRMDGSLFDLRRLSAKTKTIEKLILEAVFANNCTLMAHTESTLQLIVNKFAETSRLFDLTISLGKTEVLFQPSPLIPGRHPSISIEGTELKTVEEFKYLGSVISSDGSLDKEINTRICKASQALGRLWVRVLNQHNIQLSTKLLRSTRQLFSPAFYMDDRITNLEILDRAGTTSIEAMILKTQLRWTGHVIRMDSDRILKQLLYGELCRRKRKQGRPLKRFKDCIKANVAHAGIAPRQLEECAQYRTGWRALTREATKTFENNRRVSITEACERRKAAAVAPKPPGQFPCSRLGLHSHLRVHPCT
ncbi:hypothetical protein ACOMHN_013709 [Nucella lapillus]